MNTTKQIIHAAFVAMLACTACSDDEQNPLLEFPQGTESTKTVGSDQAAFTIPITAQGDWTASVTTEDAAWIVLPEENGNGNKDLEVLVDPNTSTERRNGQIAITNGTQTLTYSISQGTLFEEKDENDEINYAAFGKTKVPLGFGVRVKKNGKNILPTKLIMNIANLEKLSQNDKQLANMTSDYVSGGLVSETEIELYTAENYQDKKQDIKATLKVSVGFGLFKLGLNGGFSLNRKSSDLSYAYRTATTVPYYTYSINDFDEYMNNATALDTKDKAQDNIRKRVLGGEFIKQYDQIVQCFDESGKVIKQDQLNNEIARLDKDFGPVFCSQGTTGGSVNVEVTANTATGADTMRINGSLTIGFNCAFNFDSEATADYLQSATNNLKEISVKATIKGGNFIQHDSIITSTEDILTKPENIKDNTANLLKSIRTWRTSLKEPSEGNNGNTILTDFNLTGIWELFKHPNLDIQDAMQNRIKKYMRERYPNETTVITDENGNQKTLTTCPYLVNIQDITN